MEPNLLFVYGILKRGKSADLTQYGGKFIGVAKLEGAQLYHIGHGVGLRLEPQSNGDYFDLGEIVAAHGEVWEIPDPLWDWLDSIESNGFVYTRKVVTPEVHDTNGKGGMVLMDAWTYVHTFPGMKYTSP